MLDDVWRGTRVEDLELSEELAMHRRVGSAGDDLTHSQHGVTKRPADRDCKRLEGWEPLTFFAINFPVRGSSTSSTAPPVPSPNLLTVIRPFGSKVGLRPSPDEWNSTLPASSSRLPRPSGVCNVRLLSDRSSIAPLALLLLRLVARLPTILPAALLALDRLGRGVKDGLGDSNLPRETAARISSVMALSAALEPTPLATLRRP